jgi:hypothetical protein
MIYFLFIKILVKVYQEGDYRGYTKDRKEK